MESDTATGTGEETPEQDTQDGSQKEPLRRRLWEWLGFGQKGEKTGLDLIQAGAALSIPIVVAIGGFLFTADQNRHREKNETQRYDNDKAVEELRSRNDALQAYFNEMSELMLDEGSRTSEENAKAHSVARARTLAILQSLDATGKRRVLTFLYESGLIGGTTLVSIETMEKTSPTQPLANPFDKPNSPPASEPVIGLQGADLSRAHLSYTRLRGAALSYVNLRNADLSYINLGGADLRNADLRGANLKGADLKDADLERTCLSGVDLSETLNLGQPQIDESYGTVDTKLPDYLEAPSVWVTPPSSNIPGRFESPPAAPVDLDQKGIGQMGILDCLSLPS